MTPNYLEFHTIKSDEPKLLPPVKTQRNTKITKKRKGKKVADVLRGRENERGRTCLEHPLQGKLAIISEAKRFGWIGKLVKQHDLSILLKLKILRKVC